LKRIELFKTFFEITHDLVVDRQVNGSMINIDTGPLGVSLQ
jgi:hypothetical protein